MRQRIKDWVDASLPQLGPTNPVHIHVNELTAIGAGNRDDMLAAIKQPFLDVIDILGERLVDVMPTLVIPLEFAETLVCEPPDVRTLDLAAEPPSIYLGHRDGAKVLRAGELYRCFLRDFTIFAKHPENVVFFFEVFRGEKERTAGWEYTRTILGEHYLPVHRTGWSSGLDWD